MSIEACDSFTMLTKTSVFLDLPSADFTQVVKDNSALFLALHPLGVSLPVGLTHKFRISIC